jgi:hypothetical protein
VCHKVQYPNTKVLAVRSRYRRTLRFLPMEHLVPICILGHLCHLRPLILICIRRTNLQANESSRSGSARFESALTAPARQALWWHTIGREAGSADITQRSRFNAGTLCRYMHLCCPGSASQPPLRLSPCPAAREEKKVEAAPESRAGLARQRDC